MCCFYLPTYILFSFSLLFSFQNLLWEFVFLQMYFWKFFTRINLRVKFSVNFVSEIIFICPNILNIILLHISWELFSINTVMILLFSPASWWTHTCCMYCTFLSNHFKNCFSLSILFYVTIFILCHYFSVINWCVMYFHPPPTGTCCASWISKLSLSLTLEISQSLYLKHLPW